MFEEKECQLLLEWDTGGQNPQGSDIFYEFINSHLISHLCPFDGFSSHSVVILDNCSIHHGQEVIGSLRDVGVMIHFLPLYSPDLNPIEEAFSKVKMELKNIEPQIADIETAILASFATITTQDCNGWISHSSVYNTHTQAV